MLVVAPVFIGSSPLARGTPRDPLQRRGPGRFIPARAGNTDCVAIPMARSPVHPRSRGEHRTPTSRRSTAGGSSPLARGTPAPVAAHPELVRFIPARAGNTGSRRSSPCTAAVHPRSRGEHLPTGILSASRTGSSPLARGTPGGHGDRHGQHRFIPARAGNTGGADAAGAVLPVHPRSRGEHSSPVLRAPSTSGSSPLARGTPTAPPPSGRSGRFIPARAGNTGTAHRLDDLRAVHPRSRGEHPGGSNIAPVLCGSSPLARGTRLHGHALRERTRFIPARAGNTLQLSSSGAA